MRVPIALEETYLCTEDPSRRVELCKSTGGGFFSINSTMVFSLPYDFVNSILFSLAYFKNTVHNTHSIQNMCWPTVYVICKVSGQQWAISS